MLQSARTMLRRLRRKSVGHHVATAVTENPKCFKSAASNEAPADESLAVRVVVVFGIVLGRVESPIDVQPITQQDNQFR